MIQRIPPTYFGPWQWPDWNRFLRSDCVACIINPLDGPGSRTLVDSYYGMAMAARQRAKKVYGYVDTARGGKSGGQLTAEMALYLESGFVDDVFFDQVEFPRLPRGIHGWERQYFPGSGPIYNPGVRTEREWFDKHPGSLIVTYEGPADQYPQPMLSIHADRQIHLVYGGMVQFPIRLGFGYCTADGMPNPWDSFNE